MNFFYLVLLGLETIGFNKEMIEVKRNNNNKKKSTYN